MYIFLSCCGSVSSSSLRVPERVMSIAGKVRLSGHFPIEDELGIAGALELLEDHLVHAAAGIDQRRSR